MRTRRRLACSVVLTSFCCAAAIACGSSSDSPPAGATAGAGGSAGTSSDGGGGKADGASGTDGAAGTGGTTFTCEKTAELDMGGTWAAFARLSVTLKSEPGGAITVCPVDQIGESTLLLLVDVKTSATDKKSFDSLRAVACSLSLPVVTALVGDCDPKAANLVSTQIIAPQPLIDALPFIPVPNTQGKLSGLDPGATFSPDRFTFTIGTTKKGANMPKWLSQNGGCGMNDMAAGRGQTCESTCVDDCGSIVDDDKDNWAGVTAHVCGTTPDDVKSKVKCQATDPSSAGATLQGRALIDFQVDPRLDGTAKSSCEVMGTVDAQVLYNIVGADIYLANTQISVTSAIKSLPSFVVDPQKSKYRMIRVDGKYGTTSWGVDMAGDMKKACATAIKHQNEIL
jgi:hypothetical protein